MNRIKNNKTKKRKIKKNKINFFSRKNKNKNKKGGGEKERAERIIKDNFRNMFMKLFKKMKSAIELDNSVKLNTAIEDFKNGFRSNQHGINTLIPVTNNTIPIYKKDNSALTPILVFVPTLVIIFNNIEDKNIRKILIKNFIKNKGNINLKSYTQNVTALSSAIDLRDKELVSFLLENGADIRILTEEQKKKLDSLLTEKEVEKIVEPEITTPKIKLVLHQELPSDSGYSIEIEPEFWKPIFKPNEMFSIRKKINDMINLDSNIQINNSEVTELWSVCKINQTMIPTYFTPMKNEPYQLFGSYISDKDIDFSHFNIILCAALIVFGIISYKMIGQDYKLIFKGGKAIQLVLASMPETSIYKSEDIDILIMPDKDVPYDVNIIMNLSGHIAYLIKWFLNTPETQYRISVQQPDPENPRTNPFLFKISYIKVTKKQDFRKQTMVDDFRQFADVDFKELPQQIIPYFETSIQFPFYIEELDENVLFCCPNIGSLLDEKIYYYAKYIEIKKILEQGYNITEHGYENVRIPDCNRFLDKFKKAILAMNKGLQKQRFPGILLDELLEKEKKSLMNRLVKIGIENEDIKTIVLQSLYPN
jgi:hypothetical protein